VREQEALDGVQVGTAHRGAGLRLFAGRAAAVVVSTGAHGEYEGAGCGGEQGVTRTSDRIETSQVRSG
jgi:hypothetical protein